MAAPSGQQRFHGRRQIRAVPTDAWRLCHQEAMSSTCNACNSLSRHEKRSRYLTADHQLVLPAPDRVSPCSMGLVVAGPPDAFSGAQPGSHA